MQSIFMQIVEQQARVERERTDSPLRATAVWEPPDENRRPVVFQRLTEAIEAVSHKLTSAEYLELYNAALGVHQS